MKSKKYNSRQEHDKEVQKPTVPVPEKTYSEGVQQGIMYGCIIGVVLMYLLMK